MDATVPCPSATLVRIPKKSKFDNNLPVLLVEGVCEMRTRKC